MSNKTIIHGKAIMPILLLGISLLLLMSATVFAIGNSTYLVMLGFSATCASFWFSLADIAISICELVSPSGVARQHDKLSSYFQVENEKIADKATALLKQYAHYISSSQFLSATTSKKKAILHMYHQLQRTRCKCYEEAYEKDGSKRKTTTMEERVGLVRKFSSIFYVGGAIIFALTWLYFDIYYMKFNGDLLTCLALSAVLFSYAFRPEYMAGLVVDIRKKVFEKIVLSRKNDLQKAQECMKELQL